MAKWEHQTSRSQRKGKSAAGEKNTVSARRRRAETAKNEQKVRIFGRNLLFSVVQIKGFWRSTSPIVKGPPIHVPIWAKGGPLTSGIPLIPKIPIYITKKPIYTRKMGIPSILIWNSGWNCSLHIESEFTSVGISIFKFQFTSSEFQFTSRNSNLFHPEYIQI